MYLTIRRYDGAANAAGVAQKVNEGLLPIISQHPGFIAYYGVDSGGGVMAAVSVFLTQALAEESNKKAADWVRQNMATLLPNPPQVTTGEVLAYKK